MVVVIIVLFIVVVFAFGVHHYAKVFWWRRSSQSQFQSLSIAALGTGTGLDPLIPRYLPVSIFQRQDSSKDGLECSVCLSEFVEGEKLRILPECNHGFHVDCIDTWFQSHNTCPLCRTKVVATQSWSNQTQITYYTTTNNTCSSSSSTAASLEESTSNNTANTTSRHDGMLVIDIPGHTEEEPPSSSPPVIMRLRSLQRGF